MFNAEPHISCFSEVFHIYIYIYGQTFSQLCACTNRRLENLANMPLVGCTSHKLNPEVNHMLSNHADLRAVIHEAHVTMKSSKYNLKMFQFYDQYFTRVSGRRENTMLRRIFELHDDVLQARNDENSDLQMNVSFRFKNKTIFYAAIPEEIKEFTKHLQKEGRSSWLSRRDVKR